MTAAAHRFRKSIALAAVALGVACLFVATSITAPALAAMDAPLKPTPSGGAALKNSAATSNRCSRSDSRDCWSRTTMALPWS